MIPKSASSCGGYRWHGSLSKLCLAWLVFALMFGSNASATGAGKSNVACQGTIISPTDDLVAIVNAGKKSQTFCIEGEHRITTPILVRTGQSLIGTTPDARISGAVVIGPWQATSTANVFYYDGAYAATKPHQQKQLNKGGANVCYLVTTYQDDLFFRTGSSDDQRIMRVLSQAEVDPTKAVTTKGQAITAGEAGRFFFDYVNHRIYLNLPNGQDPNTATVDLALSFGGDANEALISGAGQSNVTLQNLFLEKAMNYGAYEGIAWVLKDMTIRFIHNVGVYNVSGIAGQPATMDDTLFTNIGRMAVNAGLTTNVSITNSEMSWNNIANFRETTGATGSGVCQGYNDAGAFHIYNDIGTAAEPAVTIDNLWSHDNIGDGLWSDGGTQYTQITNSTFNGNERYGYDHEISCQVLFSGNTIYHNGYSLKNPDITGGGVNVSDSNDGTFSSNVLYDNFAGSALHLTFQQVHHTMDINKCLGANSSGDTSNSLKNNQVLSNEIYTCSGEQTIGKVWGPGGSLNSRGNQFESNQYHLADSSSRWFSDGTDTGNYVPQNWTTWQQGNHDTQGALTVGCTYIKAGSVATSTTVALAPTAVVAKASSPVTVTATVQAGSGDQVPTGSVNFFNGTVQVGSAPLSNGIATLDYDASALGGGNYLVTATYMENGVFATSSSVPQKLGVQDFQITAQPATVTVATPGQSGTATLTITQLGGFNQTLSYSCSGLPAGATCAFTPVSSTSETLTVKTTAATARLEKDSTPGNGMFFAMLVPGFLGIVVSVRSRKRNLRGMRLLGLVAVLAVSTLWLAACAGVSNGSSSGGSKNQGTPPGSSSVMVTATAGGAGATSHAAAVTLTVN